MHPSVVVLAVLVGLAAARPQFQQGLASPAAPVEQVAVVTPYPVIPILKMESISDEKGQYSLRWLGGDGTAASEQGELRQNQDGEYKGDYALVKTGAYRYTAPNGQTIEVTWVADENGFHPTSNVIPETAAAPTA